MADLKPPLSGYALWLMASGKEHEPLQQCIDDASHALGGETFSAHVTLLGLLDYTASQRHFIEDEVEKLTEKASSISAELMSIGSRAMYFQALFLTLVPTQPLKALNQAARQAFHHEADPPFMPHASLAYGDFSWAEKQAVISQLITKLSLPWTITLNRLALVNATGFVREWKIENERPLHKK